MERTSMAQGQRAALAVSRIAEALARRTGVRRVLLFGSRARGDHRERSDIDLAVDAPGVSATEWQAIEEVVDGADTLLPIDLVRLDQADPELVERIEAEKKVLFER